MKHFLILFSLLAIAANGYCQVSQKQMLDFLIKHGAELVSGTEKFLHEQRQLGHENLLSKLEKSIVEVELLVIDLKNKSASTHLDQEKPLHELHLLEQKLFTLESLIEEEILHIRHQANQPQVTPTPSPSHPTPIPDLAIQQLKEAKALAASAIKVYKTLNHTNAFRNSIYIEAYLIQNYARLIESYHLQGKKLVAEVHILERHVVVLKYYMTQLHANKLTDKDILDEAKSLVASARKELPTLRQDLHRRCVESEITAIEATLKDIEASKSGSNHVKIAGMVHHLTGLAKCLSQASP